MTATDRLRAVRQVYRRRGDRPSVADTAYGVYVGLLIAGIVGVPVVRAMLQSLVQPPVLDTLADPALAAALPLLGAALLAGSVGLGALRGPALPSPFFVHALVGSDLPRRSTLARPFLGSALAVVPVLTGGVALVATSLAIGGRMPVSAALTATAGGAVFAVLTVVAWLAGQALAPGRRALLMVVFLLLGGVLVAAPGLAPIVLIVAALAACVAVPFLLQVQRGPVLLEQSHRWQAATIATGTADLRGALRAYEARPSVGRALRGIRPVPLVLRFLVRDAVGAIRTPVRAALGAAGLVLGAALGAVGAMAGDALPGWGALAVAALGGVVSYTALGPFTDGLRHAADAAASPALYGLTVGRLYAVHAALPVASALVLGTVGVLAVGAPVAVAVPVVVVAAGLVAVRAFDSAKGPLPVALLTPIPTPAGDMSALVVFAWQLDALALVVGMAAIASRVADPAFAVLLVVLAAVGVAFRTRRRLQEL